MLPNISAFVPHICPSHLCGLPACRMRQSSRSVGIDGVLRPPLHRGVPAPDVAGPRPGATSAQCVHEGDGRRPLGGTRIEERGCDDVGDVRGTSAHGGWPHTDVTRRDRRVLLTTRSPAPPPGRCCCGPVRSSASATSSRRRRRGATTTSARATATPWSSTLGGWRSTSVEGSRCAPVARVCIERDSSSCRRRCLRRRRCRRRRRGTVVARLEDPQATGIALAEIDPAALQVVRSKMPIQQHRGRGRQLLGWDPGDSGG